MKTLLKITCALAIALFVSMSVNAASPQDTKTGTLTVNVPQYLALTVTPDVTFLYKEYEGGDIMQVSTPVRIDANTNWTFAISANGPLASPNTTSEVIPLSKITYSHSLSEPTGDLVLKTTALTPDGIEGTMDSAGNITWNLADLGHQYFGVYTAELTYKLY